GSGVVTKYNQLVQQQYDQARQSVAQTISSQQCTGFLSARGIDYLGILADVGTQVPYDGLQSNLSLFAAGLWTQDQASDTGILSVLKKTAVCNTFSGAGGSWNGTVAQAQVQFPAGDAYFYTGKEALKNLLPSTVLHEALHNLTRKNDADLYHLLT